MIVTSSYSTRIFYRGVSGFATGCTCGVWCRGLTTCLLYVSPIFGNRHVNNRLVEGLTYWIVNLLILGSLLAILLTKPITQWLSSKHKYSQSIHITDLVMKTIYKDQISLIFSNEKDTYITKKHIKLKSVNTTLRQWNTITLIVAFSNVCQRGTANSVMASAVICGKFCYDVWCSRVSNNSNVILSYNSVAQYAGMVPKSTLSLISTPLNCLRACTKTPPKHRLGLCNRIRN